MFCAAFVILLALLVQPVLAQDGFSDWAAIVVAGDWHAHNGSPSEIFDNARRDVTRDLIALGFARENVVEFSVRPGASDGPVNARAIGNALWDLSNRTRGGCLLYFSSHGSPDGVVLGNSILPPNQLARMLSNSCAGRPTVVVISACALFIVAGKRYAELGAPHPSRATLRRYSRRGLRLLLGAAAVVACGAYAWWAFSGGSAAPPPPTRPLSMVPFVLWLGRYRGLVRAGAGEAPEELVVRDPGLVAFGLLWAALFANGVYGG